MALSPLESKQEQRPIPAAASAPARMSRRLTEVAWSFLPLWDFLAVLVLLAVTQPIADLRFLGQSGDGGVGMVSWTSAAVAVAGISAIAISGTYGLRAGLSGPSSRVYGAIAVGAAVGTLAGIFIGTATGESVALGQMLFVLVGLPLVWSLGRLAARTTLASNPERVLIIGTGPVAQRVIEITHRHPQLGIEVVGFLDDDPLMMDADSPPVIGGLATLREAAARERIDRVIVAFTRQEDVDLLALLRACDPLGIHVDVVPRMFDLMGPNPVARSFEGLPLVGVGGQVSSPGAANLKRGFDLVFAGLALIVASPLLLALAVAVKLGDGGPVFFRQTRAGMGGAPFDVMKFRTMRQNADQEERELVDALQRGEVEIADVVSGIKEDDDPRVTSVGRFLRKTSLDELPQLWNVVRGEMSIVGPRPLRSFEVESLADWQRTRQMTRPGITGFWQVLGRSAIPWGERVQLDYDYVRHWSFRLDLWILARTPAAVLRRRGAK